MNPEERLLQAAYRKKAVELFEERMNQLNMPIIVDGVTYALRIASIRGAVKYFAEDPEGSILITDYDIEHYFNKELFDIYINEKETRDNYILMWYAGIRDQIDDSYKSGDLDRLNSLNTFYNS